MRRKLLPLSILALVASEFCGCKPSLDSQNPKTRERAVRETVTNQITLTKVALEDPDEAVRAAATVKILDEETLRVLALKDNSSHVRKTALDNITNQAVLVKVLRDPEESVRLAVVLKLTDQAVLETVATGDTEALVRKAAVGRLTNQIVLSKIASEDTYLSIRAAAVETLTDEVALAALALDSELSFLWITALKKLKTNQPKVPRANSESPVGKTDVLVRFRSVTDALPMEHAERLFEHVRHILRVMRIPALAELGVIESIKTEWESTRQDYQPGDPLAPSTSFVTGRIVTQRGEAFTVSLVMLNRSGGRSRHSQCWSTKFDYYHQLPADKSSLDFHPAEIRIGELIGQLYGFDDLPQDKLAQLAMGDVEYSVRIAALKFIVDQTAVGKVAAVSSDERVRTAALDKVTDQQVLYKLALESQDWSLRREAIKRLTDQAILAKIATESKDSGLRRMAAGKVSNLDVLAKIALQDSSQDVREAAAKRMIALKQSAARDTPHAGRDSPSGGRARRPPP